MVLPSFEVRFVRSERTQPTPERVKVAKAAPVIVGRGDTAQLRIPDAAVNKAHAVLVVAADGDGILVIDTGSANGTWVGSDHGQIHHVRVGGEFRIGDCFFVVAS